MNEKEMDKKGKPEKIEEAKMIIHGLLEKRLRIYQIPHFLSTRLFGRL